MLDGDRFRDGVAIDLVSYLVVVVPDLRSVAQLAPSLVQLVDSRSLRILDLVVIFRSHGGDLQITELDSVEELRSLSVLADQTLGLLTEHDLELASFAVRPGTVGVVLLTEDHWADPLSAAARRVGGQIAAGERIHPSRIEAALRRSKED